MKVREFYLIVIGKTSTGYSAHCPGVPGCAAVGKTFESVVANMKLAMEFHFEGMVEDGCPIPKPCCVHSSEKGMEDDNPDQYFQAHVQIDTDRFTSERESRNGEPI